MARRFRAVWRVKSWIVSTKDAEWAEERSREEPARGLRSGVALEWLLVTETSGRTQSLKGPRSIPLGDSAQPMAYVKRVATASDRERRSPTHQRPALSL